MSEGVVLMLVNRAIKDEAFRQRLLSDPDAALAGFDLTDAENATLRSLNEGNIDDFAGGLGDRTTK